MGSKPIIPDILLKDGDRVDGFLCVSLPGHTPGIIGLLIEGSKVFFSGDILIFDGKSVGPGPTFFTIDHARERESIMRITGRDFKTLLAGHGVPLHPGAATKVGELADTLQ